MSRIVTPLIADSRNVTALCGALCRAYPFLHTTVIGHSVCDRPLHALTLGDGNHAVLFAAAFHAQEWLTTLVCLRLLEDLCRLHSGETLGSRFDRADLTRRRLVFVPVVNPDGVDIAIHGSAAGGAHAAVLHLLGADIKGNWQANAAGIDINHNFDAGRDALRRIERDHGITKPAPRRFGGTCAESEPETKALCRLCRQDHFSHVVALHSQGEEIYWQYGERTPPEACMAARIMGSLSGYIPASPDTIASHGGFKDWFIEHTGRMGFTVELGKGRNPLPLDDFEDIYDKAREMLLFAALL